MVIDFAGNHDGYLRPFGLSPSTCCYVDIKRRIYESSSFLSLFSSRPKRDWLLCVARLKAVTLSWDAPLSQAHCPGLSVSETEPSGVVLSRFCTSSSRSLGRCLLLGQRSRMNLFSHHIRSLLHQDRSDSRGELRATATMATLGRPVARMGRHTER